MQNEEFQRVFNISENQNHRYNGFMLPITNEKPVGKVKKLSPKKKNPATDMVTATAKPPIKRRPKVKNCSDGVVNGFPTLTASTNTPPKAKSDFNPYAECFDPLPYPSKFNNFIRPKPHQAAATSVSSNHLAAKLANKNGEAELHRKRLASLFSNSCGSGSKFEMPNHLRPAPLANHLSESTTKASFPRPQPTHTTVDVISKTSPNNVASRNKVATSYLQMSVKSGKRIDELREKKDSEFRNYLPSSAPSTSTSTTTAVVKPEIRFLDARKIAELQQQQQMQQQQLLNEKKACEPSTSAGSTSKLYLRAKRRKQSRNKWQMDSGTRHEALQRIRDGLDVQDKLQNDLFPLNVGETGYEKSDSDSSEEYANTFQDNWFHMSEIEFDDVKRNLRLAQLYSELQRQRSQIKQNKCDLPILTKTFMKSLVDAARTKPAEVTNYIQSDERQRLTTVEPLILTKKKCAVEVCKNVALPCMPTCIRHILLCEKQTLFEQCRVRDSNSFQCDRPVLNIKYHYPVCSVHSKPEFVLPDFAREAIPYEEARGKNTSTLHSGLYKTDFDLASNNMSLISSAPSSSSKCEPKKRNHVNAGVKNHVNVARPISVVPAKNNKEKKAAPATSVVFTSMAAPAPAALPPTAPVLQKKEERIVKKEVPLKSMALAPSIVRLPKEVAPIVKAKPVATMTPTMASAPLVREVAQNLLPDWVNLSENQLVDTKTLETNLPTDFVNGFDINAPSIQSHIQEMINSESPLSVDMLMESHDLPNCIEVEEMIEEVEVTDETLDSDELNGQELVRSEDLNAVLKELPPEAFNELFSDKSDSQWTETQALERVIEEMDVRKCALIDPSLLLEDIEPSYSNYTTNYDASLSENVDTKFNDITGNCSQSES